MDWKVLLEQAPSGGMTYLGWLWSGLFWTIAVSGCAWVIASVVGCAVGIMRTTPVAWARGLGTAYVELFRNIPLLVQMFLWYFVMPEVVPTAWGDWLKQDMPNLLTLPFAAQFSLWEFTAAVLCLGLYTASRVAEQVRSGIQSLPRGQTSAGLAMGLTLPQVYRHVTLPMAFRIVIPPMTSRIPDHLQELLDGAHHRRARAHRAEPADLGVHVQDLRGLHGGHPHLHRHHADGDLRHALARGPRGGARLHLAGRALRWPGTGRRPFLRRESAGDGR